MDPNRKRAYRNLLYHAMLDIRSHTPISPYTPVKWYMPTVWSKLIGRLRHNMLVADWMHNLAQFSAEHHLDEFNEQWFWNHLEQLKARFPSQQWNWYESIFDRALSRTE